MGKTINYEKLQDVIIGAFGKDSSGVSPDEVLARINANAVEEVTNDDIDNNNSNDTNATNDNTVDNDTIDNTDNIDDNDNNDDDIVNDDNNDNNDIIISDLFKAHFELEEFDEDKILDKVKSLEEEKTALILEKEKIQRDTFIKEKGITSDVFEALSGSTLKEKEEALKKVSKLSGFKLNSSNEVKTKEIKFNSAF